jgi:hypothetical protein
MTSEVDYLTEDTIQNEEQKFVCLSFLSDDKKDKALFGIKVRGVFSTYELACEHAKKLQNIDPAFNVFVGDVGKWLPFDPNPDSIKDNEYANKELNTMMKSYMENQEKAKLFHEQRKNEMVKQNILDNLANRQDNLKDLTTKLKKSHIPEERSKMEASIKSTEEQIGEMKQKKKDIDKQLDLLNEKLKLFK